MTKIIKDRRYLGSDGVMYHYCKKCEDYLPVHEFNNCKKCPFGKYPVCKTHHREQNRISYHKNKNQEKKVRKKDEMSYLQVAFPTKDDYHYTKVFLERMGYDTQTDIHKQFLNKIMEKYSIDLH